ncbi:Manganese ABC transporter, periplasmic-binding protein SitA [Candidatus Chlamydia sanziniae]|uniref:Manganese ABC transporter, periplasmic-binding protein SitA n=2 Tax=Candidatus Chlamydia sanziniae TaxID=1806891 RepID=A0A1A9HXC6_9CHLA|nr:Manganese ABC transporter, periplasmic-binding protein SitA [Candidatus Chlamydia sanziniae]
MFGCISSPRLESNSRPCVLSMNRMIHDCVQRIVGDKFGTLVLIEGALDPHAYEMVKGDEDKIMSSSLIFCNGLGLEHTLSLRKHLDGNPKAIDLGGRLVQRNVFAPLQEDGIHDPHIWLDLSIWIEVVAEICQVLISYFPEWQNEFQENTNQLIKEMQGLDLWAEKCLHTIPSEHRYLVSGHNAFSYFTRRYLASPEEIVTGEWKSRCISPEGLSPEAQISIRDIMVVVDYIRSHEVHVVFPEDTLNQDALKKIVSCLQKDYTLHLAKQPLYSDNVEENYFHTFKHNVRVITEELGGTVIETE